MLYKKIDAQSSNAISSALNLFETPPTAVSISHSSYREYLTQNPVPYSPFVFKIHPSSSFIDLSKIYVYTQMEIKKLDAHGNKINLGATDLVAPIQMIGSTFIRNLKISINGREIFDANSLYAYKAYFDAELSYPVSVKDSFLTCTGYARDSANQDATAGSGFQKRRSRFELSKSVELMCKLDADILNQELFLINQVEMDIEIWPHSSDFLLIYPQAADPARQERYVLDITSCKLYIKSVDLMDGLSLDVARKLDFSPAKYGIRKSMLKSLFLTAGRTEFSYSLFTDEVPRRVLIAMVSNDAYNGNNGSPHSSPFKFEPFNVSEITLSANGREYPQVHYNLDFANKKYVRAYHDFCEFLGNAYSPENSNGIDYGMYGGQWTVFCFMLTNSMEDDPGFQLIKDGTTSLYMRFSAPIPEGGVTLIAYGEGDGLIMIDKNRNLMSDVTV